MLDNQRMLSWSLSAAYLLCGLGLFIIGGKVAPIFAELRPPLLLPTRIFLWMGPWGWLAVTLSFSALLLVRHHRLHPPWLNSGIVAGLWVTLSGIILGVICLTVVVLYQPICDLSSNIAAP